MATSSLKKPQAKVVAQDAQYAIDEPITDNQKKMRLAHMASYIHEDAGHNLDHLVNAISLLKKGQKDAAVYDLNHALPHAQKAHMKSSKLIEETHQDGKFSTARSELLKGMANKSGQTY